jgi:RHS repeat-associated protein
MDPGSEGFATYFEDWYGQNYADQRYYNSIGGRFLTPDRLIMSAADPKNPGSWNRYAYAGNDPVNHNDPTGLDDIGDLIDGGGSWFLPTSASMYCAGGSTSAWLPAEYAGITCLTPWMIALAVATPQQPPLECNYTGANLGSDGFQMVQGPRGWPSIIYAVPVTLSFSATGGNGAYQWTVGQAGVKGGYITDSNGTYYEPQGPRQDIVMPGQVVKSGSGVSFTDTPGIGNSRGSTVISADVTWWWTVSVSVSSGGQTVECPEVAWTANVNWKTVSGQSVITSSSSAYVVH